MERICGALLRDRHESEDAAQQTFLSALRALGNGAEPREAEAWLGSIARNECLRRIRNRMREPLPTLEYEPEDGRADVHRQATSNMNAARLWQEIQGLPDQQRDAIVLREFAGLSYDELALALGVSDAAVESLLFRARGTLRRRLQTALASVNLAGAASGAASGLARILAGGAAPIATKAAAVGVGAAVLGGGAILGEHAFRPPHAATAAKSIGRRASAPAPVPPAPVRIAVVSRPAPAVIVENRNLGTDGKSSSNPATSRPGDHGDAGEGSSAGGAVMVAKTDGEQTDESGHIRIAGTSVSLRRSSDQGFSGESAPASSTRTDAGASTTDGSDGESGSGSFGQD